MSRRKNNAVHPLTLALVNISRIIVGLLFIFSGVVKLIDPKGSQYKFEEYFSAGVLNLESLVPYALYLSIFLIVLEIYLGFAVLLGYRAKAILKYLLLLILLFLFLTWYSAYFNKVTDCGCFGDAIKLTPWQSFYKDLILTILIVFLYRYKENIYPFFNKKTVIFITVSSFILSIFIAVFVIRHLPLKDFRAYKIGTDIREGMQYKGDGKIPPIHDLMLEDEQNDLLDTILKMDKVMLVIASSLEKSEFTGFPEVKNAAIQAKKKGYKVYGATASFSEIIQITSKKYDLPFEFLFCDATTLKTMIRANPGVILLKKGVITDKKAWRDVENLNY